MDPLNGGGHVLEDLFKGSLTIDKMAPHPSLLSALLRSHQMEKWALMGKWCLTTLLKYNYRTIKFIPLKRRVQWFPLFTDLCMTIFRWKNPPRAFLPSWGNLKVETNLVLSLHLLITRVPFPFVLNIC